MTGFVVPAPAPRASWLPSAPVVVWSVAVTSLALSMVGLVLGARNATLLQGAVDLHLADLWLGVVGPVAGALLIARGGRRGSGLVLLSTSLVALCGATGSYALYAQHLVHQPPGVAVAAWFAVWTWVPYLAVPTLLPLIYATTPSGGRRWLVRGVVVVLSAIALTSAVLPGSDPSLPTVGNPLGVPALRFLTPVRDGLVGGCVVLLVPLGLVVGVLSWRRAGGAQRTRLAWFVAGDLVFVLALFGPGEHQPWADVRVAIGLTFLLAGLALGDHIAGLTTQHQREREDLVRVREEERLRLHRDLHDGVGPELAGLALQLSALSGAVADPEVRSRMQVMESRLRSTVGEVRRVVDDLRPAALDELGLVGALTVRAEAFSTRGFECTVHATEPAPLPAALEVAAYRIATEAVTNAWRHARALRCAVDLRFEPEALVLEVSDDGDGFDQMVGPGVGLGVGIASMTARAEELGGSLRAARGATGGTVVRAVLPVWA